ncbi:hypothetical protein [Acetobacter persici]|uniref:hypothetical protein n=1 Tax=Acetobacter persici TaxID=1076596 RepID=UPI0039E974BF
MTSHNLTTAETAIGGSVRRINEHGWKVGHIEPAANDPSQPDLLCRNMGLNHASQRVTITDAV